MASIPRARVYHQSRGVGYGDELVFAYGGEESTDAVCHPSEGECDGGERAAGELGERTLDHVPAQDEEEGHDVARSRPLRSEGAEGVRGVGGVGHCKRRDGCMRGSQSWKWKNLELGKSGAYGTYMVSVGSVRR